MANKKTEVDRQLNRRQMARRDREFRLQRILTLAAAAVGIVVVALIIVGLVIEISQARKPAARVGDVEITAKAFKARQGYERWMTQLQIMQYQDYISQLSAMQLDATSTITDATTSGDDTAAFLQQLQVQVSSLENQLKPDLASAYAGQVLDAMIEEELARQEAAARGLTVTYDDIQLRTEQLLGYDRDAASSAITDATTLTDTATITESATATPQPQMSYDELYKQFRTNVLDITRFSEKYFRRMVEAQLLSERLVEALGETVTKVQDQVEGTVFAVSTEEDAEALRTRLNDEGADPAAIVEEFDADDDSATIGYTFTWVPVGYIGSQIGTDVERAEFNTDVGKASPAVYGNDGQLYVVFVTGHEERELSESMLSSAKQQAYDTWLSEAKTSKVEYLDWEAAVVSE